MDHNRVYAKTPSGERAMLERTRTMQRNVRMVLILVDSQSSVGDLCLKTGNPQLTESALRELEKGGFIEPRAEVDSLWEESRRVAEVIRTAASGKKHRDGGKPLSTVSTPTADSARSAPHVDEVPALLSSAPPLEQASVREGGDEPPSSIARRIRGIFSRPGPATGNADATSAVDLVLPGSGGLASSASAPTASARDATRVNRLRRQRYVLGWPAIVALSLVAMLAVLVLTTVLFPYSRYLPELEFAIAKACGRDVKVGSLRVDLYPKAALRLGDVRIGKDREQLRIAEIRLLPVLASLTSDRIVIGSLVVSGVALSAEVLAGLPGLFSELSKPGAPATINRLGFERTEIEVGGLAFSELNGEARLAADGQLQALVLHSPDRRLSFSASPLPQGFSVVLEGIDWRPSAQSPWVFDSLNLNGAYANGTLTLNSMELRIFDGLVEGSAVLRSAAQQSIAGEVRFKRINAARLSAALGHGLRLGGETDGKIIFSATADSWAMLFSAIDANGEFAIQRGRIGAIDLSEAARSVTRRPTQGGETKFESLSGVIRLTPTTYRFSDLVLDSGLMRSTGVVDVSKELRLSGRLELRMHGSVNQTRVPMTLGGTLASPTVQAGMSEVTQ